MSMLRVAVAQILSGSDPQENLEFVATQTAEAAEAGAQLVVFPEATMRRFGLPLAEIAEPVDGALGKAAAGDCRAVPARGGGRHVQSERGRPGQQHAARCRDQVSMRTTTRSTSSTHSASVNPRRWRLAPNPW